MLIKPQAIMFAPVIGLAFIYAYFKKGGIKKALVGTLAGAAILQELYSLPLFPSGRSAASLDNRQICGGYPNIPVCVSERIQYICADGFKLRRACPIHTGKSYALRNNA